MTFTTSWTDDELSTAEAAYRMAGGVPSVTRAILAERADWHRSPAAVDNWIDRRRRLERVDREEARHRLAMVVMHPEHHALVVGIIAELEATRAELEAARDGALTLEKLAETLKVEHAFELEQANERASRNEQALRELIDGSPEYKQAFENAVAGLNRDLEVALVKACAGRSWRGCVGRRSWKRRRRL